MNNSKNNDLLKNICIDLDMFSRLPVNTLVHLNRDNHFIITAKQFSYIYGTQSLANLWKSHTTEKLIKDLDNFSKTIIDTITELSISSDTNKENIKKILVICRDVKLACSGSPDIPNGGMCGLIETLKHDPLMSQLSDVIYSLKFDVEKIKRYIVTTYVETNNCPESKFTDEEWENAMGITTFFNTEYVSIYKYYIGYSAAFMFNQIKYSPEYNTWDEIIRFDNGAKIYLGEIPIIKGFVGYFERNDLVALINLGIKAVLSVTEIFENNTGGYIYSPVTPSQWENANIKHYQIPSADYCGMHLETVQKGVEFIHWNVKNGRAIYVHCKSGKSRSFLIVVCYLIKYYNFTSEQSIKYIKSKRIYSGFSENSAKTLVLEKFENMVRENLY